MEEFFRWLRSLNAASKSEFGNTAGYVLGKTQYLENYLLDGRLEISHNRAEQALCDRAKEWLCSFDEIRFHEFDPLCRITELNGFV